MQLHQSNISKELTLAAEKGRQLICYGASRREKYAAGHPLSLPPIANSEGRWRFEHAQPNNDEMCPYGTLKHEGIGRKKTYARAPTACVRVGTRARSLCPLSSPSPYARMQYPRMPVWVFAHSVNCIATSVSAAPPPEMRKRFLTCIASLYRISYLGQHTRKRSLVW